MRPLGRTAKCCLPLSTFLVILERSLRIRLLSLLPISGVAAVVWSRKREKEVTPLCSVSYVRSDAILEGQDPSCELWTADINSATRSKEQERGITTD